VRICFDGVKYRSEGGGNKIIYDDIIEAVRDKNLAKYFSEDNKYRARNFVTFIFIKTHGCHAGRTIEKIVTITSKDMKWERNLNLELDNICDPCQEKMFNNLSKINLCDSSGEYGGYMPDDVKCKRYAFNAMRFNNYKEMLKKLWNYDESVKLSDNDIEVVRKCLNRGKFGHFDERGLQTEKQIKQLIFHRSDWIDKYDFHPSSTWIERQKLKKMRQEKVALKLKTEGSN